MHFFFFGANVLARITIYCGERTTEKEKKKIKLYSMVRDTRQGGAGSCAEGAAGQPRTVGTARQQARLSP